MKGRNILFLRIIDLGDFVCETVLLWLLMILRRLEMYLLREEGTERPIFYFSGNFFLLKYVQIYNIISSKPPLLVKFLRFYKLHWPKHL